MFSESDKETWPSISLTSTMNFAEMLLNFILAPLRGISRSPYLNMPSKSMNSESKSLIVT